ncbi:beta-galactosidase [Asticcacaulis machinosus]|uniref:Beta-galactosidase n=1 Tax=Asticcacaulis machinosus TaxID=2984211 RepID=A0ABT5HIU2_9CAUL|nr:beta-galactosidase [Asticcacaulis machinosus]MDC7676157.1 beta-galactosidase [Asticcacaulis machinosus]
MRRSLFEVWLCLVLFSAAITASVPAYAQTVVSLDKGTAPKLGNILYGASYYNEYQPQDIRAGRLKTDVAMMKAAGFTVVRMGESSWGKWEPQDGQFDYAWMDEIISEFGKAGIKVIMGTPTYSIPVWMYAKHPDMLARPLNGGEAGYGMRQNMNIDDVNYRHYSERIIIKLVAHYKDNPHAFRQVVEAPAAQLPHRRLPSHL